MEGPVHHPDYYAEIITHILADRNLSEYHQEKAEEALYYLRDSRVSSSIKANLVESILLKKELEKLHRQAAAAAVTLLTEGNISLKEKSSIALHLFTKKSLGKYYQHEAAIRAWKEFSSDESTHSSISLAKEVIACNILNESKFKAHYKKAISVWKSLDLLTQGFMVCDVLQNDSLSDHYLYAEKVLEEFFSSKDEIVPWYTKARLSKIIRKTRVKKLKNARAIALAYFNSLEDDLTTNEDDSSPVSASSHEESQKKRRKATADLDFVYES